MKHEQEIIIQYQSLFNHFRNEHNLILTTSEMQEIISECKKVVCFDNNEQWQECEPCRTCGDIDGMVNPCCAGYDSLHHKNCGYG